MCCLGAARRGDLDAPALLRRIHRHRPGARCAQPTQPDLDASRQRRIGAGPPDCVLDIATEGTVTAMADELLACSRPVAVLDLSGIEFCDARGVRALLNLRERMPDAGLRLAMVDAQPTVRRVFDIVGLGTVLETPPGPAPHPSEAGPGGPRPQRANPRDTAR